MARGASSEVVNEASRQFHSVVRSFVAAGGGELNLKKCFTFGNVLAKGVLGPEVQHLNEFRIVGGAFVTRNEPCTLLFWSKSVGKNGSKPYVGFATCLARGLKGLA